MKKLILSACALTLITSASAMNPERGRLSTTYHQTTNKLSEHPGKVGLACGAIGSIVLTKVFKTEIDTYIKPFLKSVCTRIGSWFKRVFNRKAETV